MLEKQQKPQLPARSIWWHTARTDATAMFAAGCSGSHRCLYPTAGTRRCASHLKGQFEAAAIASTPAGLPHAITAAPPNRARPCG